MKLSFFDDILLMRGTIDKDSSVQTIRYRSRNRLPGTENLRRIRISARRGATLLTTEWSIAARVCTLKYREEEKIFISFSRRVQRIASKSSFMCCLCNCGYTFFATFRCLSEVFLRFRVCFTRGLRNRPFRCFKPLEKFSTGIASVEYLLDHSTSWEESPRHSH